MITSTVFPWVAHAVVVSVREERVLSRAKQRSRSGWLVSRSKALPCRCVTSPCAGGLGGALEGGGRFALQASVLELATTDLEQAATIQRSENHTDVCYYKNTPIFRFQGARGGAVG